MELSRLYGVSVDELLSLEEAEKGDAKAASSVDASTPAPAQETLAAPKKVRRQKLLLGAAAVCLALAVGLALYNNHRVKQLEWQVGSLQSQIMSVQSSLSSQIAGIRSSVREAMEERATLTAQFDYTVKRFDLDAYTCTVAFALQPKTVQDDLAVSLRLRSLASDDGTTAVELVRDEYDVYRGEAVLSMNDAGFEATAAYDTGGERQLETIRDLPGFADEALPKLAALGAPQEIAALQPDALAPICGASFTRITAELRLSENTSCMICGDVGDLTGGGRTALLCELELELKQGSEEALSAFTSSEALAPYLNDDAFVQVSVASDNPGQERALMDASEQRLASLPCRGSCAAVSLELREEAHAHGMGCGRYAAALEHSELDPDVTIEDCHDMSMRELRDRIAACHGAQSATHGQHHRRGHSS